MECPSLLPSPRDSRLVRCSVLTVRVLSHNRHRVAIRTERSVFEFRLLRGARHVPVDRTVVRRVDQIPSRHRAHVSVRLHLLQFATRQVAVRHRGRHHFHVVAAHLHRVHGTRPIETGNFIGFF